MTQRVAILISGGGSNMAALADAMVGDFPARPVLVLSNEPAAGGLAKAAARGIATGLVHHRDYATREAFEADLAAALDAAAPDIICHAGFMRILTASHVARYAGRMLNIHPSLLPKYKGLHTHRRALAAGETEHGCTVHLVTPALDDGPILGQATVPVLPDDTEERLAARVLAQEHILYPAVLRRFVEGCADPLLLQSTRTG